MAYSITNGVVENGIILENDTMTVLDGGTAISTTVNAGGRITVSEGGTANCTAINAGGELYVSSGGTATGKMTFEKGATVSAYADAIFDFDLTQAEAGAGDALVNDLSIIQGTPTCTLTVNEEQGKGVYTLAGGAAGFDKTVTVQNTLGESLGTLTVDGTLETDNRRYTLNLTDDILSLTCYALFHDQIIGNETVSVTEYEIYENPTINPDGKLRVSSGGTANDTTLNGGGMYVSSGGTANDTTLNTGSIYVSSGGTANDTTLNGGSMYVSSGGTANNMAISSGGKFSVSGSGTANNIEVYCGGSLSVGKDGTAANIMENGGNVVAKDGANVTFQANTFSAVTLNDKTTTATVHSGTTAASTTVNAGLLAVYSGGIASSATVNSGGTLFISSGGTANDTRIGFSGRMVISSGGVADIINATSNGTVTVLNGGVVNTAYVRADGKILISSGGKLTGKLICLGGVISAASDTIVDFDLTRTLPGAAPLFMFDSYDCLIKGTPTYTITVNSDQAEGIYSLYDYINNYYKRELCHQITVQNTEGTVLGTLSVGETITVSDTAYTLNLSDSLMFLQIGENITPSPYTSDGVVVYTERSATVSSGEIYHDTEIWGGQLYVLSGGTADIVSVHPFSRGSVFISSGGTANSVMVNSFCSMFVSTGGTVNRVELKSGGELRVSSGGTAMEVKEDGGYVSVADGADVTFTPNTINGLLLENASATVHSGTTANSITVNNTSTHLFISSGGTANGTKINSGWVYVSRGGKANSTAIIKGTREVGGAMFVSSGGVADDTTIEGGGWMDVSSGGVANNTMVNASMFVYTGGTANGVTVSSNGFLHVGFSSGNWFESGGTVNDAVVSGGSMNVAYGGVANRTTVNSNGKLNVFSRSKLNSTTVNSGGALFIYSSSVANGTTINAGTMRISGGGKASGINVSGGEVFVSIGGVANDVMANSGGKITVSSGGTVNDAVVSGGSMLILSGGLADNTTLNSDGALSVGNGGKLTGKMTFETGADVSMTGKAILDFDLTQAEAGAGDALVNDLSIIQGTPIYTLTVNGTLTVGDYKLAEGTTDFTSSITVKNKSGETLGTLTVGETVMISDKEYLLTNEDSVLSVTISEHTMPKWTYLVYMAADNDLCYSALYDIVSMQQAKVDSQIDIYVLADRTPAGTKGSGDYETINGTYKWGSDWEDTRVGKITYNPGLTVTVDWESWGELDTGSFETLERFVNWVQEESPAENYGLMLWDHGAEDATLCYDLTTDPDWDACITVSEVAGLLKEKGNIPIVIFNACLLGSELVATQMAGSTDVIVVSEPSSYGMSTFNSNMFFQTISPDMTPQEMAAIMVRNVEPQNAIIGEPSMLSSVDVTDSRLGDALEALAVAVAAAGNDADKDVLIRAMLQASQNGSDYNGGYVQQSDLGFMIRDVMADPDYGNTSEGFRKALADVKTALEAVVLEYRSVPAKRGSGIAVCNPVYTAKVLMTSGSTTKEAGARISSYLSSTYNSNPLWGGLLNDLCATYLAEIDAARVPTAVFSVSEVSGLVDGRTVTVSDLGGFSGRGELFDCIKLRDERFFGFVITAADKSTGGFTVISDVGAAVTVSLLAANGTEVATGTGSVSFHDLAVGTYYLRLQSETDCRVTLTSDADWWTGVDRFEDNDTCETAAMLGAGYHTGLITCEGDEDYYLIGSFDTLLYTVEVYGEEGWTVGEYDPYDDYLYEADYADGKYTMMMDPMGCLLVEGTADLAKGVNAYSVNVIPYESEWPADITLDDLVGTKDGVSWEPSILMNKYTVEYSMDDFEHTMRVVTTSTAVDLLNLPSGTYQWRVTADSGKNPEWFDGEEIVSDDTTAAPKVFRSNSDANDDLFFATPNGTWDSRYCAKHVGSVGDWTGTNELVSAAGKGRIQDLFFGSADPGTLYLTDSENGDALFLDDIYTGLPEEIEENTARLFRLRKIIAGAGDDIVDMTSQRFEYTGGALTISGGDGDDVIWANGGSRNSLFGDAGNDRITGASGDDVIVGGIGNDRMHGGGGDDIFTFCDNWGIDTVEQLETGTVTLWFISGSMENWNSETLTYSDGENSVTVSGVSADQVSLKFEYGGSRLFASLINMGAFSEFTTRRIFDESTSVSGILANS